MRWQTPLQYHKRVQQLYVIHHLQEPRSETHTNPYAYCTDPFSSRRTHTPPICTMYFRPEAVGRGRSTTSTFEFPDLGVTCTQPIKSLLAFHAFLSCKQSFLSLISCVVWFHSRTEKLCGSANPLTNSSTTVRWWMLVVAVRKNNVLETMEE